MGGTGRPLGKTFFLQCQRRHPELPKIPTYLQTTPKWTAQKIHLSNRKLSYWLCRRKRAPHLVTDEEFKDFCDEILCSKYQSCSEKEVLKQTLEIVAAGRVNNRRIITQLKEQKVKPSMASS